MKLSLRHVLIFTPLVLVWTVFAVTFASSRASFRRVLTEHARNIMSNTTSLAMKRAESYLDEARAAEQLIHRILMAELLNAAEADARMFPNREGGVGDRTGEWCVGVMIPFDSENMGTPMRLSCLHYDLVRHVSA